MNEVINNLFTTYNNLIINTLTLTFPFIKNNYQLFTLVINSYNMYFTHILQFV